MLEQLFDLVRNNSQEAIVQNPAIPNEHNEEAINTVTHSIFDGLQSQAQSGNLAGLIGMLSGQAGTGGSLMNNPMVAGIAQNAIGSLMRKFGINNSAASGIVASVLPMVLTSLIRKTNDRNDSSIDMNSAMGSLLGGQRHVETDRGSFDFNQIGGALADGKLDMNDLMRMGGGLLGGGGGQQQQSGGGLGGLLGGLFGR